MAIGTHLHKHQFAYLATPPPTSEWKAKLFYQPEIDPQGNNTPPEILKGLLDWLTVRFIFVCLSSIMDIMEG